MFQGSSGRKARWKEQEPCMQRTTQQRCWRWQCWGHRRAERGIVKGHMTLPRPLASAQVHRLKGREVTCTQTSQTSRWGHPATPESRGSACWDAIPTTVPIQAPSQRRTSQLTCRQKLQTRQPEAQQQPRYLILFRKRDAVADCAMRRQLQQQQQRTHLPKHRASERQRPGDPLSKK